MFFFGLKKENLNFVLFAKKKKKKKKEEEIIYISIIIIEYCEQSCNVMSVPFI